MPFLDHALRIIYLLYFLTIAAAAPRNITIDDELGDELTGNRPSFSPLLGWAQGAVCDGCLKLDPGKTIQRTWHAHTRRSNETWSAVSFPFTGTAVFVYCILANNLTGITALANYSFFLDGAEVGRFIHVPENGSDFQYNVLVYSNTSVPNGNHTFQLLADSNVNDTLILFDYAQYTLDIDAPATIRAQLLDTESPPANQQSNSTASPQQTAAIVAGVLGGVAIIGLGIILFLLRHRLRRRPAGPLITPFVLTDMSRSRVVEEQLGNDRSRGQARGRQSGPTSGGRRERPRAQPDSITPFTLQQAINPQPEKGARPAVTSTNTTTTTLSDTLATPISTSNSSSGPSGPAPPNRPKDRHHRHRRRPEHSSSDPSASSASHDRPHPPADGRRAENQRQPRPRGVVPEERRRRVRVADSDPSQSAPSEGSSRHTQIPVESEQSSSSRSANHRSRPARHALMGSNTSVPSSSSSDRRPQHELAEIREVLSDIRTQHEAIMSVVMPPPSYE
ncbi:hypothetical protein BDN71DRAFT_636153 [Pleurotus eryngii]|uniref:Uncharacterized protein n=1 Tax=Pleurotus eryngii TaxID=5323 RepID=A0A9P6A0L6_PLEER|nr:hypothetical protein BDN71DRAFT_636153 [Pleurotus eryngii]